MFARKIAVLVVIIAALAVGLLARPWVEGLLGTRATDDGAEGGHGHAHGEGEEAAVCEKHFVPAAECGECSAIPVTLADLEPLKCDHDIRLLDCGECRWEAGVVSIDPHLLAREGVPGGLLVLAEAEMKVPSSTLRMTGHITANQNRVAHVGPRVAGVVSRSLVEVGARVKKDD
ncbi:MAG: hypothetical protein RDV41_13740, partial [Planctomycetota bacterium]|nr:hypothetical protein [Planctomycetota bacterium]